MPLISVIVPAYNADKTLEKTVNDILNQTFSDYELIIVNDGSSDNTLSLIQKFAALDSRVKSLNQSNGGLSNARNNGVKIASGEYITFIDADDRVELYYLEYLVRALKDTHAEMIIGRTDRVKEEFAPSNELQKFSIELLSKKEAVKEMLTGRKITVGSCNRLVPKSWYLEFPFLEGKKYEDLSHSYKLHLKAESVAFVDAYIYHYVMRGGSITGSKVISLGQCQDYYEAINLCSSEVLQQFGDIEEDIAVLKYRDYMSLFLLIERCTEKDINDKMCDEIISWCKSNWRYVSFNRYAPLEVKLRAFLFRISPRLYEKLYYIGIRFKGKAIS